MKKKTLAELSKKMRQIDITMLTTHTDGGVIASRPMSNNGEVEYDGTSFYFTWEKSRMVSDIKRDPKVSLVFQGEDMFLVAVQGEAEIVTDNTEFEAHWTKGLDQWFKDGVDTKGLVMIKMAATRIHYWDGENDGELKL
ncbi:MAG: pyridoxamine 5'-phosphate oxidase family protein [Hyphomicrobiales bacterium]|nr:pyridoxamine 5'-phosphate oxidase family protein [Hyphomicrobiales bacterium]